MTLPAQLTSSISAACCCPCQLNVAARPAAHGYMSLPALQLTSTTSAAQCCAPSSSQPRLGCIRLHFAVRAVANRRASATRRCAPCSSQLSLGYTTMPAPLLTSSTSAACRCPTRSSQPHLGFTRRCPPRSSQPHLGRCPPRSSQPRLGRPAAHSRVSATGGCPPAFTSLSASQLIAASRLHDRYFTHFVRLSQTRHVLDNFGCVLVKPNMLAHDLHGTHETLYYITIQRIGLGVSSHGYQG